SRFWSELGTALEGAGIGVRKLHLSLAERVYWRGPGALSYRGGLAAWPGWLEAYLRREAVTDIVYFADRMPYHAAARRVADRLGLRTWAVEFGYLRPDWLTIEPGGMGAYSSFPRDPAAIARLAAGRPRPDI